jgi:hypothetical protein|tara:strand:+ start:11408 stop:11509 length:102 start_codon:yes stop_codon:yes gene_type:complete
LAERPESFGRLMVVGIGVVGSVEVLEVVVVVEP